MQYLFKFLHISVSMETSSTIRVVQYLAQARFASKFRILWSAQMVFNQQLEKKMRADPVVAAWLYNSWFILERVFILELANKLFNEIDLKTKILAISNWNN